MNIIFLSLLLRQSLGGTNNKARKLPSLMYVLSVVAFCSLVLLKNRYPGMKLPRASHVYVWFPLFVFLRYNSISSSASVYKLFTQQSVWKAEHPWRQTNWFQLIIFNYSRPLGYHAIDHSDRTRDSDQINAPVHSTASSRSSDFMQFRRAQTYLYI